MAARNVFIVKLITRQMDMRIDRVYEDRASAVARVLALLETVGQDGGIEVSNAYFIIRPVEMTEGWEQPGGSL